LEEINANNVYVIGAEDRQEDGYVMNDEPSAIQQIVTIELRQDARIDH